MKKIIVTLIVGFLFIGSWAAWDENFTHIGDVDKVSFGVEPENDALKQDILYVRIDNAGDGKWFWANKYQEKILAIIMTAKSTGKKIEITYIKSSGPGKGTQVTTGRIIGISLTD